MILDLGHCEDSLPQRFEKGEGWVSVGTILISEPAQIRVILPAEKRCNWS
jgi:hypothetical protein